MGEPRTETATGGRVPALVALLLALAIVLFLFVGREDSHTYRLVFENAGQLVKGDIVRIGGTPAGSVTGIELTADSRAEIEVSVKDEFAPLHRGTTATIRAQSLIGIANRYVDIHPGPNFRPALERRRRARVGQHHVDRRARPVLQRP